ISRGLHTEIRDGLAPLTISAFDPADELPGMDRAIQRKMILFAPVFGFVSIFRPRLNKAFHPRNI
ncbi:hypothetical protein ACPXAM_24610, partial [Escherichia coli]|uniref:hypothetical protein n=1 Tax=Escherichia coli TaxID=562 RepID=UPI003CE5A1A9